MKALKKVLLAVDVICLAAWIPTHNVCLSAVALATAIAALVLTITDRRK